MRALMGARRTISIRSNELGPSAPRPFVFFYLSFFDFDQFKKFNADLQVTNRRTASKVTPPRPRIRVEILLTGNDKKRSCVWAEIRYPLSSFAPVPPSGGLRRYTKAFIERRC